MGIKTIIKIPRPSTPIYVRTVKHLVLLETGEFTLFMVHLVGSLLAVEVVLRLLGQSHEDALLFRRLIGVGLFSILLFFGGPAFVAVILKHVASKRMVIYGATVILAKGASMDTLFLIGWRIGTYIALGLVGMLISFYLPASMSLFLVLTWLPIGVTHLWFRGRIMREALIIPVTMHLGTGSVAKVKDASTNVALSARDALVLDQAVPHACDHCGKACSNDRSNHHDDVHCSCLLKEGLVEEGPQGQGLRKRRLYRDTVVFILHCRNCHQAESAIKEWWQRQHFLPLLLWSLTWTGYGIVTSNVPITSDVPLSLMNLALVFTYVGLVTWQVVSWRRMRRLPHVTALRRNVSFRELFDQVLIIIVDTMVAAMPLLGFVWLLGTWAFLRLKISAFFIINALGTDDEHCTLCVRAPCPYCRGPLNVPQQHAPSKPPRLVYVHRPRCRLGKTHSRLQKKHLSSDSTLRELDVEVTTVQHPVQPWFSSLRAGLRIPAFMLLAWLFLARILNSSSIPFNENLALNVTLLLLFTWFLHSVVRIFWHGNNEKEREEKHARLLEHTITTSFLMFASLVLFQVVVRYLTHQLVVILAFIFLLVLLFYRG